MKFFPPHDISHIYELFIINRCIISSLHTVMLTFKSYILLYIWIFFSWTPYIICLPYLLCLLIFAQYKLVIYMPGLFTSHWNGAVTKINKMFLAPGFKILEKSRQ